MLNYYFWLGWRSLKRNPGLTALIVLTLALGVATSVASLTVLHMMSADPIPSKSARLMRMVIDNNPLEGYLPGSKDRQEQLTYRDVQAMQNSGLGVRRSAILGIRGDLESPKKNLGVDNLTGLAASADVFALFDMPFLYGGAWHKEQDNKAEDVIVLAQKTAVKHFGNANPVGQRIRFLGSEFLIVGVLADWKMSPRFYYYSGRESAFLDVEEFLIPFNTSIRHQVPHAGGMSCHGKRESGWQGMLDSECTWLSFWFELDKPEQRLHLQSWVDNYVAEQHRLGRFPRQAKNEVMNVREWLQALNIVADDSKISAWVALSFLLLCLVNAVGLLLAKFSRRAAEVGVRRALGATRGQIFAQFFIESSVLGIVGAILGGVLAQAGLALIGLQARYLANLAKMDASMLALAVALAILSAILAGLLPTWRACQVRPALQLKSQ